MDLRLQTWTKYSLDRGLPFGHKVEGIFWGQYEAKRRGGVKSHSNREFAKIADFWSPLPWFLISLKRLLLKLHLIIKTALFHFALCSRPCIRYIFCFELGVTFADQYIRKYKSKFYDHLSNSRILSTDTLRNSIVRDC